MQGAFFVRGLRVYQASIVGASVSGEAAEIYFTALDLRR